MTKPTVENIDKWLFEAAEGTLSSQQEALLDAFLLENPAFTEEKELWSDARVSAPNENYGSLDDLLMAPWWMRPIFYWSAAAVIFGAAITWGIATSTPNSKATVERKVVDEEGQSNKIELSSRQMVAKVTRGNQILENQSNRKYGEGDSERLEYTLDSNPEVSELKVKASEQSSESSPLESIADERGQSIRENTVAFEKSLKNNKIVDKKDKFENDGSSKLKAKNVVKVKSTFSSENHEFAKTSSTAPAQATKPARDSELDKRLPTAVEKSALPEKSELKKALDAKPEIEKPNIEEVARKTYFDRLQGTDEVQTRKAQTLYDDRLNPYRVVPENGLADTKNTPERIQSNYNHSASAYIKRAYRKLSRMMDNPIALKNAGDMYYHVPNMSSLDVNFAHAGGALIPRLQTVSRAQYVGYNNQQIMNQLAFDSYVRAIRGGIGVQVLHQYYGRGAYQIGQLAVMYSPKIGVSKNVVIEPGFRFKMGNKDLNAHKLTPGQFVELERGNKHEFFPGGTENIGSNLWYNDIGLSLLTNTKWFTAGVQLDNLTHYYDNVYNNLNPMGRRAGLHLTANVGTEYVSRNKNISFSPYVFYQKMENLSEIWAGSIFRYKKFTIGGAHSSNSDVTGSIGFKTSRLMLTYNADLTSSSVYNSRLFSHQLSLRILFKSGPQRP